MQFELASYAGKIKALSVVWGIYAVFSLVTGLAGLTFAHAFFANHFGQWNHGQWSDSPPDWLFPAIVNFVWFVLLIRTGLAILVAWGLYERAQWARIVAIIVAILSLIKFPFGTALGIWTLVVLLGYRNSTLYEQLP
jgi:hypothetical protein